MLFTFMRARIHSWLFVMDALPGTSPVVIVIHTWVPPTMLPYIKAIHISWRQSFIIVSRNSHSKYNLYHIINTCGFFIIRSTQCDTLMTAERARFVYRKPSFFRPLSRHCVAVLLRIAHYEQIYEKRLYLCIYYEYH